MLLMTMMVLIHGSTINTHTHSILTLVLFCASDGDDKLAVVVGGGGVVGVMTWI